MKTHSRLFPAAIALLLAVLPQIGFASLIQITGTSASAGQLGWFVVDDAVLAGDTSLVASQFYDFSFSDPTSSIVVNTSNVLTDTGFTYFGFISGVWTVVGGGGDSLTTVGGDAVWIAGTSYAEFNIGGGHFYDVHWSTTSYVAAPDTGSVAGLFGLACLGAFALRRRLAA
ncbi:MAG TPA: hypothetical protein VG734_22145 [Lacunisphaera sp.]|nr:hypothetical protein [Lacunisphaera sp.]